jgi:hypothetical protein
MEQETIRARTIELVNERGDLGLTLDGGGGDREPGIIVYGPRGPESAVTLLVRRDTGMPYIMANTATGTVVLFTFDPDGEPAIHLQGKDGNDRSIRL